MCTPADPVVMDGVRPLGPVGRVEVEIVVTRELLDELRHVDVM